MRVTISLAASVAIGLVAHVYLRERGLTLTGYSLCLWIAAVVVVSYTLLGGYMAVCWTDFIQGTLMFVAVVLVPAAVVCNAASSPSRRR